jgi:hypothetical protein
MPLGVSAWTALANLTLGSTASTVTFASISGAYRDLVLIMNFNSTAAGNLYTKLSLINSDAGSANYGQVIAYGNGSTTGSENLGTGLSFIKLNSIGGTTNTVSSPHVVQFLDYSATDKHKIILSRSGNSSNGVDMTSARWANTAAITTFVISIAGGSFASGSTFALYGVSA